MAIFLIACRVFLVPLLVPLEAFADRVSICLTALLAGIAPHFAISFDLPHVVYLTVIDRLFVFTYAFVALLVVASVAEPWGRGTPWLRRRIPFGPANDGDQQIATKRCFMPQAGWSRLLHRLVLSSVQREELRNS